MKRFLYYFLGFSLVIAAIFFYGQSSGWFDVFEGYRIEDSNPVLETSELEEKEGLVILSKAFINQVILRGYTFGEFSKTVNFLNLEGMSDIGNSAKVEILKEGEPFLTIFELKPSPEFSYGIFSSLLRSSLRDTEVSPAVFGPESFYFIENGISTNIVSVKDSILAFRFPEGAFVELKEFIALLLITL